MPEKRANKIAWHAVEGPYLKCWVKPVGSPCDCALPLLEMVTKDNPAPQIGTNEVVESIGEDLGPYESIEKPTLGSLRYPMSLCFKR